MLRTWCVVGSPKQKLLTKNAHKIKYDNFTRKYILHNCAKASAEMQLGERQQIVGRYQDDCTGDRFR